MREHPFSMSSNGDDLERIEFSIKALGDFTNTIKDVPSGTKAFLDGPYGVFTTDRYEDSAGFVLIAGGIGITPMMSMLVTAANRKDERPYLLIYASKKWEDITYREELEQLQQKLDLKVLHVLREPPEDWSGKKGYVDKQLLERYIPRRRGTNYLGNYLLMTPTASLIFNPNAGQSSPVEDLAQIREFLEPKLNLDIRPTCKGVTTAQLTHQAISQGSQMILIAGGDGTISSAASALIGTNIPLGIIPTGTVNAFAKALNIPIDIRAACSTILSGKPYKVDTATCNNQAMVVLTGIGLEPEVIANSSRRIKNNFGMLSFILSGIKELWNLNTFETWIETENQTINSPASAVTIANTAAATSLLAHGPAGVIADDGLLDVTIFAPRNRKNAFLGASYLLLSGFKGDEVNRNDIQHFRAKTIKVKTYPPQKVSLDGDCIEVTDVEISCVPRSLTVLIPA